MAVQILAHRANLVGPDRPAENSLAACRASLGQGFGLEIDLRRAPDGRFYISHDPAPLTDENALDAYSALFREYPGLPLAVNVKELGYEEALIDLQHSGVFGLAGFYFDFELLEPQSPGRTQRLMQKLSQGLPVRLASRLSDRQESLEQCLAIPAQYVWADEFDSLWLAAGDIEAVHRAGRQVYAISPELHGFDATKRRGRWAQFKAWGIDGLCTDYALEARHFFTK